MRRRRFAHYAVVPLLAMGGCTQVGKLASTHQRCAGSGQQWPRAGDGMPGRAEVGDSSNVSHIFWISAPLIANQLK